MTCRRKEVGLSRVVVQCGGIAGVLDGCLGPNGRAVLMENAGNVIITQDGTELLSTLDVCDPLVNMVVKAVVQQTKVIGDGCKITILLLRQLLNSLDALIPPASSFSHFNKRQKLIQIIQHIRRNVLWRIQRDVIKNGAQVYPLHSFEAITHVLHSSAEDFFHTKFSKFIAKNLAKLFSSYIAAECSSSRELMKLLDHLAVHTHSAIIEIFHMPFLRSHVISGFVITRRFRYLHKTMNFDYVTCVLWSIEVEEKREDGQTKDIIATNCSDMLLESIVTRRNLLDRSLVLLSSLGIGVILSSPCFPDWGISMCVKYGISLVDGIDQEEWDLLCEKIMIPTIVCEDDVGLDSIGVLERIEPFRIGTCDYVKLGGHSGHQIVLCGSTQTQCRQFSGAFLRLFKYFSSWVVDCLDFYHNNTNTEPQNSSLDSEKANVCYSYSYDKTSEPIYDQFDSFYSLQTYSDRDIELDRSFEEVHSPGAMTYKHCKEETEDQKNYYKDSLGKHNYSVPADKCNDRADIFTDIRSGEFENSETSKHITLETKYLDTECVSNWYCNAVFTSGLKVSNNVKCSERLRSEYKPNFLQSDLLDSRVGAVLYTVPHGGFVELLSKYLVMEDIYEDMFNETSKKLLVGLLNEIPWQLHRKVSYSRKNYLEFQTKLFRQFGELRKKEEKFIQPQVMESSCFNGYQSPFMLFKILDCVLHFAIFILRIECIIPSKVRINQLIKPSMSVDDDDE